ncbi:cache domain-containing sensor histidine kinase [Paenibacillus sacheonensis]|uniref:histidine kinase n=1 Tax=Paenibacillus sacheonensis TaxID=742054 RepID=A0A7X4YJE0_9BACL|nr:sensor histidine kinase [Paenibacillus sacheonensis]MBM7564194.1 two-component system sensor histidine kinase YesM [Paenibacillus sacheonensis]NBC67481.1 HAMP domain-containing protein [Paenibacillus sacheonensis]
MTISIKTKLLFSYLVLIFVPLVVLTGLTYWRVSDRMEANMLRTSRNALAQSETYLETKLGNLINATDIIYFDKTLQDIHTTNPAIYDEDLLQQNIDENNLTTLFNQIERNTDVLRVRLFIRDIPGYAYDNDRFFVFRDLDGQPWYEALKASKSVVTWIAPDKFQADSEADPPFISLARRITIKTYNVTDGVIRIDMRAPVVNDIVKQANVTSTGLSYIVNGTGDLISASGSPALLGDRALLQAAEDAARGSAAGTDIHAGNADYLTLSRPIANSDWTFISVIPYSEIKSTGKDIRFYMVLMLLATGVISYLLAYLWFNSSALRLKHLAKNIRKVTGGDFNTRIRVSSKDEIGQISQDFNYMVAEMAAMIEERFETGKKIKSLELRSLQSQINPHFLYNSLDMINWSAVMSGNAEIETMIQSLSTFYKIGLSKGDDIIPVRNEIEHVRAYVTLQNLRYQDQIALELDVDEGILGLEMLKITLQPIVENAILHGILRSPSKSGTIRISGARKSDIVVFTVEDDGAGMPPDIVERILDQDTQDEFHGYGIKNIQERIQLQYGAAYGLAYESEPGRGTTVRITLPAIVVRRAAH